MEALVTAFTNRYLRTLLLLLSCFFLPIYFNFSKQTNEFTIKEIIKVLKEVQFLPTPLRVGESQITVKHDLILSIIDGRVCNALTDVINKNVTNVVQLPK